MKKIQNFLESKIVKKYIFVLFLIGICLSSFVIVPTYAKFTNDYSTEDDVVGFSFDFGIGISDIEEYSELKIGAMDAEVFNVKIDNDSLDTVYYGVWYRIDDESVEDSISIAKLERSEANTSGSIEGNGSSLVSVIVRNVSNKDVVIDIGVASSNKDTNSISYLDGRKLISGVDDIEYLSSAKAGSYVNYVGSNGCSGNSCLGYNANYVGNSNKGYCYKDGNKYSSNGFRIGYVKDNTVYLISAGSLECVATDSSGKVSFDNIHLDSFDNKDEAKLHLDNLNMEALNYCNEEFSYGGVCNSYSAWNMDAADFKNITGSSLDDKSCYQSSDSRCGTDNDLINNGGYYWISNSYLKSNNLFYWDPSYKYVGSTNSSYPLGVRPVIRLDESVYIVSGTGTSNDPYNISNEIVFNNNE